MNDYAILHKMFEESYDEMLTEDLCELIQALEREIGRVSLAVHRSRQRA